MLPYTLLSIAAPLPLSGRPAALFDASGSGTPPGTTPDFAWDFGDGTKGSGAKVEHTYASAGRYQVTLTMTADAQTGTAAATVAIPPTQILAANPARAVLVEAETFAAQGEGAVKVVSGRKGASGAIITAWQDNLGHWLEWKAKVPATGKYRLVLKYCSDSPAPRRALTIDGASPAETCKDIRFERTGGFSTGTDDWRYLTVGGEATPVALDLSSGEHLIRLANLGDGLALDWLLLLPVDNSGSTLDF